MGAPPHCTGVEIRATPQAAANALAWLASAGVDVIVDDRPRNWLAPLTARQPPPPLSASAETRTASALTTQFAARSASPLPADITDLASLNAALAAFDHPLRQSAPPQLLTGALESGVVVLIDQPDYADAPAAQLLARMLGAIGLGTAACATGYLLPWPTPAGRPPRDAEVAAFAPFLDRALGIVAPRLVLALGDRAAAKGSYDDEKPGSGPRRGIASMRGKWLMLNTIPMIATFHPRQLLAQPDLKRLAWADLQAFADRMPR